MDGKDETKTISGATTINGKGKTPCIDELLAVARNIKLDEKHASH